MTLEEQMGLLIVRVAHGISDPRMSGPDGSGFGFCAIDYPEAPGGFGDNELEAAINFLNEMYPEESPSKTVSDK